ncbi:hypothetical protein RRG08_033437 [Elysia crispata]|uniref:Uncharacterized protein n=1 Tax=Elysia crispata TaxID=231223 RepID=A0AAE1E529_9GAST|nr:hypothetical protein RRG08_033437 [Elysia crispata]
MKNLFKVIPVQSQSRELADDSISRDIQHSVPDISPAGHTLEFHLVGGASPPDVSMNQCLITTYCLNSPITDNTQVASVGELDSAGEFHRERCGAKSSHIETLELMVGDAAQTVRPMDDIAFVGGSGNRGI